MYKLLHSSRRCGARQTICRVLTLAMLLNWQGLLRAQTNSVTLNSPSASDLQTQLANGQGNPWVIYLNFTNTIVTTTPFYVGYPNTMLVATTTNSVVISGNNTSQVFNVPSGVNFTIENLTITAGNSIGTNGLNGTIGSNGGSTGGAGGGGTKGGNGLGGAIYNRGNTTLINCSLLTNTATGGVGGNGGNGGNGSSYGGNGGNGGSGGSGYGGGIYNSNTLVLSNCTIAGNSTIGGTGGVGGTNGAGAYSYVGAGGAGAAGAGAGIYNTTNAVATLINCTFNNNFSHGGSSQNAGGAPDNGNGQAGAAGAAGEGGGIDNFGTNIIINCTFSQNIATGGNGGNGGNAVTGAFAGSGGNGGNAYGGSLYNGKTGFVAVTNCTFASGAVYGGTNGATGTGPNTNSNGSLGTGYGANIANVGGIFKLKNSILAYPTNAHNAYTNGAIITDQNNNISTDLTPKLTQANSFTNRDPELLALATNGGYAETMALLLGSPAINAIFDSSAPPFDERDYPRPLGIRPCIGAYEYGTLSYVISGQITPASDIYTNVIITANGTLSYSVQPDTNGNFIFHIPADTYVVVPQPTNGFIFAPINLTVTIGPTNVSPTNLDFAATATYTVGGQIANVSTVVTVDIYTTTNNNNTFFSQSDSDNVGNFTFTNLPSGSYTIIPQPTSSYGFSPASLLIAVPPDNTNIDVFSSVPPTFTVSGQIANVNTPVTVSAIVSGGTSAFASTLTDVNGNYILASLPANSYTITPQPTNGITFSPSGLAITVPPSTNGVDFTGVSSTNSSVSGQVANVHAAVTIIVSNGASLYSSLQTDANGNYTLANMKAGSYTVTPQPTNGIFFMPATMSLTLPPSASSANFAGTTTNRPVVASPQLVNQNMEFSFSGVPNLTYWIQASTNPASPTNWITISTNNSGTSGAFIFTNSITDFPQRFFRAVVP